MKILFDHSVQESDEIYSFYFSHQDPINFTPGQFIELKIPQINVDDKGDSRYFTISSSPLDKMLSITTRITDNPSSYKKALLTLEKGTILNINSPMGDFVLPKIIQTPIIFIAIGIGITPFVSIIKFLDQTNEARNIHLFYAVRDESEVLFNDIFDKPKIRVTTVVNNPSDSWGGERGQLNANMIFGIANNTPETLYYLSGPTKSVEDLSKSIEPLIGDKKRLITDFFPGYD